MQRKKQHRTVLKNLIRDERITPHRALLAESILKSIDATDDDNRRIYEVTVLSQIGDNKVVTYYLNEVDKCTDTPIPPMLTDAEDHRTIQNNLQRDNRIHPNWRFIFAVQSMCEDADTEHERLFFKTVISVACLDANNRFKLIDRMDDGIPDAHISVNLDGRLDKIKEYMAAYRSDAHASKA